MQELCLGEIIRRRREKLNISQEALCEGICDRVSLSRFETGRQSLSRKRVAALLQRLGLPDNRFYALLSEGELALEDAEHDARSAGVALERAAAEERPLAWARFREKLAALEALGPDNPFIRQCSLSLRAVMGTEDGPYPFEERLGMQLEAIRLTVPRFDLEHIGLGLYSAEELRLILQIASTHTAAGQYGEAVRIYRAGMECLEATSRGLSQYLHLKPTYMANCANALALMGRHQEGLELAEEGILAGLDTRRYHVLSILLWVKAYCLYHLGQREESVRLYRQVYSLLLATRDMAWVQLLKEQIKELLGVELGE